jgi:hypothetical protein
LISAGLSARPRLSTGKELLGYWQNEGLVGTRPEIEDSQATENGECAQRAP